MRQTEDKPKQDMRTHTTFISPFPAHPATLLPSFVEKGGEEPQSLHHPRYN